MADNEAVEDIEEISNDSNQDVKLYQILTGSSQAPVPSRSSVLREFKKKPPGETRTLTPDQAPNIDTDFDTANPGMFRCLWCKRIFKTQRARLTHSNSCSWQPDKIEVLSRMRLTRKEERERAHRAEERVKRTVSSGSALSSSKYRRHKRHAPTPIQEEHEQVASSGSSPRSEASHDSSYLRTGDLVGNFDEIRAEFSRSKRRRLDAYRLLQKLKADDQLMMRDDLKELAKGIYDADISMLDVRINQLEKENNKLKEIVSLREENRLMRAKLAEREKQQQQEKKD